MAKKSGNNFSCVLNYKRDTTKCKSGFRTDDMVFVWGDSSKTQGLWICRETLEDYFPNLKGSKTIKLLVSTVRHQGYSKVSQRSPMFVRAKINSHPEENIFVDRTVTTMIEKLFAKWNVEALYFKFNRMD